ncbi:phosphoglycerate mutase family protein [Sodiomyces alkalinus F11]|uniref:Phosphoglycerate mutase family protein n=1 Tax=Sodiomyces alkalinus (strain CBS 110278 / VKM F-3762 / F11) TaxID=1314773 RepID=A0A3N2PNZ3_SODAK|nr:phosphoglycerate mutase family protein [Sodiomyces alkalinus F11]ROT36241.1 phosphoglycerate mutase family protein [Sodiomyces alkalinus F11]
MNVTIHLVRHAQGFHNLSYENESIPDPLLTDFGKKQCANVRNNFHSHEKLTCLVSSPMRRTIYTGLYSFGPYDPASAMPVEDDKGDGLLPVIAIPELQEVSDSPCDTGSAVPVLAKEFGSRVDFSRVPDGWTDKVSSESPWEPRVGKLEARARTARLFLRELAAKSGKEEVHIAAVTHGGFLHFLTDDWHGIEPNRATGWENCEYRSYRFVDPSGQDPGALLQETEESWKARLGDKRRLGEEEQAELRRMHQRELAR